MNKIGFDKLRMDWKNANALMDKINGTDSLVQSIKRRLGKGDAIFEITIHRHGDEWKSTAYVKVPEKVVVNMLPAIQESLAGLRAELKALQYTPPVAG